MEPPLAVELEQRLYKVVHDVLFVNRGPGPTVQAAGIADLGHTEFLQALHGPCPRFAPGVSEGE